MARHSIGTTVRVLSVGCVILALSSTRCYADALVPWTSVFAPGTAEIASLALGSAILLESLLLKMAFKKVRFWKHLVNACVINAVSSGVGTVLVVAVGSDEMVFPSELRSYLLFFAVTVLSEYPVLGYLYRRLKTWHGLLWTATWMNVLSYIGVVAVQIGFIYGAYAYGEIHLKRIKSQWIHSEILANEEGHIYMVTSETSETGARQEYFGRLDIQTGDWQCLGRLMYEHLREHFERFDSLEGRWEYVGELDLRGRGKWDVSAGLLACQEMDHSGVGKVSVFRLPEFELLGTVEGRYTRVKIDPSGRYLALLANHGEVVAQRNGGGYWVFGDKCRLTVYDLSERKVARTYGRTILGDGLCWSPDSRSIAFVSFEGDSVFGPTREDMKGKTSYYGYRDIYPKYIYFWNLDDNSVQKVAKGKEPDWSHDGKRLLYVSGGAVYDHVLEDGSTNLLLKNPGANRYLWSPSDKNVCGVVCFDAVDATLLTVLHCADPSLRYVVYPTPEYDFDWD